MEKDKVEIFQTNIGVFRGESLLNKAIFKFLSPTYFNTTYWFLGVQGFWF